MSRPAILVVDDEPGIRTSLQEILREEGWRADAVACAKRDLKAGEILDGEGGCTVVGRLMPARDSLARGCLPLGLAHGWKLLRPVAAGQALKWGDVAFDAASPAVKLRREMERMFGEQLRPAA